MSDVDLHVRPLDMGICRCHANWEDWNGSFVLALTHWAIFNVMHLMVGKWRRWLGTLSCLRIPRSTVRVPSMLRVLRGFYRPFFCNDLFTLPNLQSILLSALSCWTRMQKWWKRFHNKTWTPWGPASNVNKCVMKTKGVPWATHTPIRQDLARNLAIVWVIGVAFES